MTVVLTVFTPLQIVVETEVYVTFDFIHGGYC
jgi:hypothetical protein